MYGDMAASNWWWRELEKLIAKGKQNVTIVPLIIATDQTTLSIMCGGQKAYPVYVTFGNLDKDWRRKPSKHGMYLLGYLPIDAFEDVPDKDKRQRLKADLVHRVMEKMLEPLRVASEEGLEMWCPDGRLRHIYPRIGAYTADWPEQSLQCCTSEGSCPICKTKYSERGNFDDEAERREREETLCALRTYFRTKNEAHLDLLKLKPVWPWWGDIPDVNLHDCITPDLLHQAYQGMFKAHLVPWMKKLHTPKKLDERFAAMPQAEGLKRFPKGLSVITKNRWTGRESKQVLAQFLPAVVSGLSPELSRMVRVLVDFMYRAHATSLTDADLDAMLEDLEAFHELKGNLVGEGKVYETDKRFRKIAKLHMLRHWIHAIRELGTPDGFNTEAPENLHIEYAKVPWRASNKVEPLQQMVMYIQRQEAIRLHRAYLDKYLASKHDREEEADDVEECELEPVAEHRLPGDLEYYTGQTIDAEGELQPAESTTNGAEPERDGNLDVEPIYYPNPTRHLAAKPTVKNIRIRDVIDNYHASNLISGNFVSVWHKLYLHHPAPSFAPFNPVRCDVVRARPPRSREPGVWDVALYLERPNRFRTTHDVYEKHGIKRYRAGRVRAIFNLPAQLQHFHSGPLAYLEIFTPFDSTPSPFTRLHSTKFDFDSRDLRRTLVIPVSDVFFACHLVPKYHTLDPDLELHAGTDLLADGEKFWLNHYYNHNFYQFIQHWRRRRPTLAERLLYNLQRAHSTGTPSIPWPTNNST
ncbi:Reverse gyrase [Rhizoctonia solani]|uniref:Reverse gyrase n=1 Tax=Rhizoctonia solani TaxID=456999 RepID=A0A0K6G814_9AGAM|nr:Reverse gyrase [Rhizoctonia solani]